MAESNGAPQKRFLYITVQEASGKSKDQEVLWEPSFTEGFVRVEVRGGVKTIKASTMTQSVQNLSISWKQELRVEVTDDSKELRIMLCKERPRDASTGAQRRNTAILAACGIYVKDVLEAVPIDKYFELFKPSTADSQERALGGFIRVTLRGTSANQGRIPPDPARKPAGLSADVAAAVQGRIQQQASSGAPQQGGGGGKRIGRIILLCGVAAAIAVIKTLQSRKK
ncbi:unnamed protein product [Ostreobium quekettii]|uniref:C2 domain-containing protein n=1 Tax=Ostreobium quekettii TaxID=121088 RepID=A0A8S1J1C1_9CHLO|nr:unnamed protein product [Ostreobium quekettii]